MSAEYVTVYMTPALDFPSEPIEGDTKATVELVANDWMADRSWRLFEASCRYAAEYHDGLVDPNLVRADLTNHNGDLCIEPRRYSAFWSRAASKSGFLTADGWTINDDVKGGNRGKPLRRYRLRTATG